MKMQGFEFDKDSIFSQVNLADAATVSPAEHARIGLLMMREIFDGMVLVDRPHARELFELLAHTMLTHAHTDGVRERMTGAITTLRTDRGYPQPPEGGFPWCEKFRQRALREDPSLRSFAREPDPPSPRRTKADREAESDVLDLVMTHRGEILSATGWEGFIAAGRGFIVTNGANAGYTRACDTWQLPPIIRKRVKRLVQSYDPTKEIVLLFVATEGGQSYLAVGKRTPALPPEECLIKWAGTPELPKMLVMYTNDPIQCVGRVQPPHAPEGKNR